MEEGKALNNNPSGVMLQQLFLLLQHKGQVLSRAVDFSSCAEVENSHPGTQPANQL